MSFIYPLLFALGFLEEFIAIVYYGFVRKGLPKHISIVAMIRNIIWWLAILIAALTSIFEFQSIPLSIVTLIYKVICHTLGVGIGAFIGAKYEDRIHEQVFKLARRRGKKKRWWALAGERKK